MGNKADFRRRLTGVFFLLISALMLIAGETILSVRLKQSPGLTLLYWGLCFLAAILAMLVALLDLAVVRRRLREETRGLFDETLERIAREKETRNRDLGENNGSR